MQSNSIHNPNNVEHVPSQNLIPTSGDNFTFVTSLDGVTDPISLLGAIEFLDDYAVALAYFKATKNRTDTP